MTNTSSRIASGDGSEDGGDDGDIDGVVAEVFHDIRHYAATVSLLARVLEEGREDRASMRAATEGIANCARTITQLVDGAVATSATRLDLVVDFVADQTRLLHGGRLIVATEPVQVLARRIDLVRIMSNILDNAREAADGGVISIVVAREEARVTARISNPIAGPRPGMEGTGLAIVERLVTGSGAHLATAIGDDAVEVVIDFPAYVPPGDEKGPRW